MLHICGRMEIIVVLKFGYLAVVDVSEIHSPALATKAAIAWADGSAAAWRDETNDHPTTGCSRMATKLPPSPSSQQAYLVRLQLRSRPLAGWRCRQLTGMDT